MGGRKLLSFDFVRVRLVLIGLVELLKLLRQRLGNKVGIEKGPKLPLTLKPRGAFRDFHEALAADWREIRHEVGFARLTNEGLWIVGPND